MAQVNIYQAKTGLSALVDRAAAGEEIVIAKNGRPRARLVPLSTDADDDFDPRRWREMDLVDCHGNVYPRNEPLPPLYEWTDEEIAEMVDAPFLTQGDGVRFTGGQR